MKIATWNINSIHKRLPLVLSFLKQEDIDILCIQETKTPDDMFPVFDFTWAGYHVIYCGEPKNNGVAIISKYPISNTPITSSVLTTQKRLIRGVIHTPIHDISISNVYVPAGIFQDIHLLSEGDKAKWQYKLDFLRSFYAYLKQNPCDIVAGDFNMVSCLSEIGDTSKTNYICCSEQERHIFSEFIKLGYDNVHTYVNGEKNQYSWWSYQFGHYASNIGYKLDHILCRQNTFQYQRADILTHPWRNDTTASDHAPVIMEIA